MGHISRFAIILSAIFTLYTTFPSYLLTLSQPVPSQSTVLMGLVVLVTLVACSPCSPDNISISIICQYLFFPFVLYNWLALLQSEGAGHIMCHQALWTTEWMQWNATWLLRHRDWCMSCELGDLCSRKLWNSTRWLWQWRGEYWIDYRGKEGTISSPLRGMNHSVWWLLWARVREWWWSNVSWSWV